MIQGDLGGISRPLRCHEIERHALPPTGQKDPPPRRIQPGEHSSARGEEGSRHQSGSRAHEPTDDARGDLPPALTNRLPVGLRYQPPPEEAKQPSRNQTPQGQQC